VWVGELVNGWGWVEVEGGRAGGRVGGRAGGREGGGWMGEWVGGRAGGRVVLVFGVLLDSLLNVFLLFC
jgi:hypothetical protein